MNRLHGNHTCHLCGQIPDLGFVYSCQQDHLPRLRSGLKGDGTLPLLPDHGTYFEDKAELARSLGMSPSVVRQMRAGEYSHEQTEVLFAQRRYVIAIIKQAQNAAIKTSMNGTSTTAPLDTDRTSGPAPVEGIIASAGLRISSLGHRAEMSPPPIHSVATLHNTPTDSVTTTPTKKTKKGKCNLQVCHACRPFFQDRVPMSVEAVLNNEIPVMSENDMNALPVRNANILRDIGLRSPSDVPEVFSGNDFDPMTLEQLRAAGFIDNSTPTTNTSIWTDTTEELEEDAYPCPGLGVCPLYSPTEGCAYDLGFDDGHRAFKHGFVAEFDHNLRDATMASKRPLHHVRGNINSTPGSTSSTGSSISLPDVPTAPLTPPTPRDLASGFAVPRPARRGHKVGKAATFCGDAAWERKRSSGLGKFGVYRNNSHISLGSEIEVEGGIALTEEAVGTGTPDIIDEVL